MVKSKPVFWWWYFAFSGIKISDVDVGLSKPIFGDATIISRDSLKLFFETRCQSGADKGLTGITMDVIESLPDTVIGVRLPMLSTNAERETKIAEERFLEIASVISLWSLPASKYQSVAAPQDRIGHKWKSIAAISEDFEGCKKEVSFHQPLRFETKGNSYTRSDFVSELDKSRLSNIANILLNTKTRGLHDSLRRVLSLASQRMADGIYANAEGEIVSSVVNAFEILLSNKATKFELIGQRLETFCSMDRLETDADGKKVKVGAIDELFKARHLWIHEGKKPAKRQVDDALIFGLEALIQFADLISQVPKSTSHEDLLQWFDHHKFVRSSNRKSLKDLNTLISDPFDWKLEG